MTKQIVNAITSFFVQENIVNADNVEIYQYGIEQILINLRIFIIIGMIATISDMWIETIFISLGIIPIRMVAGGYHAKTLTRCSVLTILVYTLNIFLVSLLKANISNQVIYALWIIVLLLIFAFAPIDHMNMRLNIRETILAKRNSRIIGIVLAGLSISTMILLGARNKFSLSILMGVLTAAVALCVGSIARRSKNEEM
jgi:Membrane protein putatively involved in post-translational modification of the autoinducing quorum-sensing peptide